MRHYSFSRCATNYLDLPLSTPPHLPPLIQSTHLTLDLLGFLLLPTSFLPFIHPYLASNLLCFILMLVDLLPNSFRWERGAPSTPSSKERQRNRQVVENLGRVPRAGKEKKEDSAVDEGMESEVCFLGFGILESTPQSS